jgi:hypothetical protein
LNDVVCISLAGAAKVVVCRCATWGNCTALNIGRDNIGQHRLTQRSEAQKQRRNKSD